MSPTPNQDRFKDLPLHILKQKAAVENQPNVSLTDWIKQAAQTYAAATDADSSNQTESAYYHYFKAAGLVSPKFSKLQSFPSLRRLNHQDSSQNS
jgi:hypothetical protein